MTSILKLPACCPYIIIRKIGEGGGGQVYQAMHKETKDCVAIKVINKEDITHYLLFDGNRVPAEIVLLAKLSHPNIVKYIDHFKHREHWCLVMEYLSEYRALFEYSCDLGMISERVTQCITQQLLKTIKYCYNKGCACNGVLATEYWKLAGACDAFRRLRGSEASNRQADFRIVISGFELGYDVNFVQIDQN